uniref:Uncharacterized protein n=1 Tax=Mustela putorius furo TaxID=9669 RepID=M3Z6Y5_MUSPF
HTADELAREEPQGPAPLTRTGRLPPSVTPSPIQGPLRQKTGAPQNVSQAQVTSPTRQDEGVTTGCRKVVRRQGSVRPRGAERRLLCSYDKLLARHRPPEGTPRRPGAGLEAPDGASLTTDHRVSICSCCVRSPAAAQENPLKEKQLIEWASELLPEPCVQAAHDSTKPGLGGGTSPGEAHPCGKASPGRLWGFRRAVRKRKIVFSSRGDPGSRAVARTREGICFLGSGQVGEAGQASGQRLAVQCGAGAPGRAQGVPADPEGVTEHGLGGAPQGHFRKKPISGRRRAGAGSRGVRRASGGWGSPVPASAGGSSLRESGRAGVQRGETGEQH